MTVTDKIVTIVKRPFTQIQCFRHMGPNVPQDKINAWLREHASVTVKSLSTTIQHPEPGYNGEAVTVLVYETTE